MSKNMLSRGNGFLQGTGISSFGARADHNHDAEYGQIIAPEYANVTFPVTAGKSYCTKDGKFYVAATDIATAEEWNAEHWSETDIASQLGSAQVDPEDIAEAVTDWLGDHVDPETGYVIDDSLTIADAAADAKATGDAVSSLMSAFASNAFIPEVEAGYYSATGAPQSASANKEVRTGFYKVVGKRCYYIVEKSVDTNLDMWFAYVLEAMDGTKTRYTVSMSGSAQKWVGYIDLDPDTVKSFAITYRGFDGKVSTTLVYPYGDLEGKIAGLQPLLKPLGFNDYSAIDVAHTFTTTDSARSQLFIANVETGVYVLDATVPSGYSYEVTGSLDKVEVAMPFVVVKKPLTSFTIYVSPSAVAGLVVKLRKLTNDQFMFDLCRADTLTRNYITEPFNVTTFEQVMRTTNLITVPASNSRVSSTVIPYSGEFSVALSAYNTYDFAIQIFNRNTYERRLDSGWKQAAYSFVVTDEECFIVVIRHTDNSNLTTSEVPNSLVTVTPKPWCRRPKFLTKYDLDTITKDITTLQGETAKIEPDGNELLTELRNSSPCYDHLHVNETGANQVIPHESLYHIRMSKNMGFKMIELNVQATSDGVMWCNHGASGKFGGYFHHVDGETDISNIATNSVTWAWIAENVRYNSTIAKYQTRPATLEECLAECARCNLIPFVQQKAVSDSVDSVGVARKAVGDMGLIAYGATRVAAGRAPIFVWDMSSTTKEEALAVCKATGKPLIWATAPIGRLTDAQMKEITETLHQNGFFVGVSYSDADWDKYRAMGVDFNGTTSKINRINDSNICAYSSIFDWNDYTITGNPTNNGGYLTFGSGGTITPILTQDTYEVCGYDFEIVFKGTLSFTDADGAISVTHDTLKALQVSRPIYNDSPSVTFTLSEDAEVQDLFYKASKFN